MTFIVFLDCKLLLLLLLSAAWQQALAFIPVAASLAGQVGWPIGLANLASPVMLDTITDAGLSKKHNLLLKCLRAGYRGFGNIAKKTLKISKKRGSRGAPVSVLVRRLVVVSSWISKHPR